MRSPFAPVALAAVLAVSLAPIARAADPAPDLAQIAPTSALLYGPASEQRVDVFLPVGRGPFPVVVFIHGGCWRSDSASAATYWPTLKALAARGMAVWSIGYRRVDEPGGAYPGMYQDVAQATDLLVDAAPRFHLDLNRVVFAGHSAGGHLALWDAGRPRLPATSPLRPTRPLHPRAVFNLAGPGDLGYGEPAALDKVCGTETYARLVGAGRSDPLADTSPARLLPLGVTTVQFTGTADRTMPTASVQFYGAEAAKAGENIRTVLLPGANHRAPVDPRTPEFDRVARAILEALG